MFIDGAVGGGACIHIGVAVHREERRLGVIVAVFQRIRHRKGPILSLRSQFYLHALEHVCAARRQHAFVVCELTYYDCAGRQIHDLRDLAVLHEDVTLHPVRTDDLHPVAREVLSPSYRHRQRLIDVCAPFAEVYRAEVCYVARGVRLLSAGIIFIRDHRFICGVRDVRLHISRNARLRDISRVVHRIERKAVIPRPRGACRAVRCGIAEELPCVLAREVVHAVHFRAAHHGVCKRMIVCYAPLRKLGRRPPECIGIGRAVFHIKEPDQSILAVAGIGEYGLERSVRPFHGVEAVAHQRLAGLPRARDVDSFDVARRVHDPVHDDIEAICVVVGVLDGEFHALHRRVILEIDGDRRLVSRRGKVPHYQSVLAAVFGWAAIRKSRARRAYPDTASV